MTTELVTTIIRFPGIAPIRVALCQLEDNSYEVTRKDGTQQAHVAYQGSNYRAAAGEYSLQLDMILRY